MFKARQRGVAVAAETLGELTYIKAVRDRAKCKHARVMEKVLKKRKLSLLDYRNLSPTFRLRGVSKWREGRRSAE